MEKGVGLVTELGGLYQTTAVQLIASETFNLTNWAWREILRCDSLFFLRSMGSIFPRPLRAKCNSAVTCGRTCTALKGVCFFYCVTG